MWAKPGANDGASLVNACWVVSSFWAFHRPGLSDVKFSIFTYHRLIRCSRSSIHMVQNQVSDDHVDNLDFEHGCDVDKDMGMSGDEDEIPLDSKKRKKRVNGLKGKDEHEVISRIRGAVRWNSTYLMLEAATCLKRAFDAYEDIDLAYKTDLSKKPFDGVPIESDWDRAKLLLKFLKHFYNLILCMFGSSYVTSNIVFHEICEVDLLLKRWLNSEDVELRTLESPGSSSSRVSSFSSPSKEMSMHDGGTTTRRFSLQQEYMMYMTGGKDHVKSELEKYLSEDVEEYREKFDILKWWKMNTQRFPILSKMARDIVVVPVSTVALEAAFSTGGRVLDAFRSSLSPKIVQAIICAQDWIRKDSKPISIEEDLSEIEMFEQDPTSKSKTIGPVLKSHASIAAVCGNIELKTWLTGCPQLRLEGDPLAPLALVPPPPRAVGTMADPPQRSTSSDTSIEELSLALESSYGSLLTLDRYDWIPDCDSTRLVLELEEPWQSHAHDAIARSGNNVCVQRYRRYKPYLSSHNA
ncbi:UNVERIFIED_CONTAM: Zinc finger BED domain-containing protein DAYSLEEPER [Sesamum calycinum]|uniref:Zinc finger BED domain-containing protein DAYSLEEPER n=1 Tax=Sesamum calycinum TaxID=2727403 RepID=A0AAW2LDF7_9LAMI